MEEEMPDLISSLPCQILQLIVSLIPLKEAIRTSILSTAWRSIWEPIQVDLEFDSDEITSHGASKHLNQIMGSFLSSYHSPQLLKLSLTNAKDEPFLMATKGVEKELHLEFSEERKMMSNFYLILEPGEKAAFSSLKTLHLRSVTKQEGDFVSALFSNCLVLESMKLGNCHGLQNINFKANNCFQRFELVDCKGIVSITISAPNLKYFRYRGVLPKIELKSTPCLIDVSLNLRDGIGHSEFDCEDVLSLLDSLKDVEILTVSGWLLEWLCAAGVIFGQLEFKFNKLKELWWIDSLINRQKRKSLACFLNITTFLEKLFVNIDQNYSSVPCPLFHQYWHEPHFWMHNEMVKCNAAQLNHLKIVNMVGFTKEEDQLLLMDLLLHKAIVVKEMTVTSPDNRSWQVAKIPQSQLKMILRCHPERIVVSSSTMECFFVLTEEVNNGLLLKSNPCL